MMKIKKKDDNLQDYALMERHQMMRGAGLGEKALKRPQIGVVSSWGEINPAATHLDKVTEKVKAGIWAAGGTPREFVISSICTSMAGHDNYHLPHRDLVAGYIETVAHIAPEAAAGGPLALVQDGDLIEINIKGKKLELLVSETELRRRFENWSLPKKPVKKGYLSIYSKMATSPDKGAALDYDPN